MDKNKSERDSETNECQWDEAQAKECQDPDSCCVESLCGCDVDPCFIESCCCCC